MTEEQRAERLAMTAAILQGLVARIPIPSKPDGTVDFVADGSILGQALPTYGALAWITAGGLLEYVDRPESAPEKVDNDAAGD